MVDQTFDLTDCSRRSYSNTRNIQVEFAVIAFALAATGLVILVYQFIHGTVVSSFRVIYGVPYLVAFAGAIFLGWGSTKFAPGATLLEIGADGMIFSFPRRGKTVIRWNDPHLAMNLVDARASPFGQKYGFAGFVRLPRRPSTQLTSDALEALTTASKAHGLSVSVRERGGRWSIAGPRHLWVEIRAPGSRPTGRG